MLAEPAAGLLSNDDCLKFATPYLKEIVDAVQDENFIVVLHNCGNTGHCTQSMAAAGAWALHFGNKIDMVKALEDTPEGVLAMGNIDPVAMFKVATAQEMKTAGVRSARTDKRLQKLHPFIGMRYPPRSSGG